VEGLAGEAPVAEGLEDPVAEPPAEPDPAPPDPAPPDPEEPPLCAITRVPDERRMASASTSFIVVSIMLMGQR
jgi:hypothetical protein